MTRRDLLALGVLAILLCVGAAALAQADTLPQAGRINSTGR